MKGNLSEQMHEQIHFFTAYFFIQHTLYSSPVGYMKLKGQY